MRHCWPSLPLQSAAQHRTSQSLDSEPESCHEPRLGRRSGVGRSVCSGTSADPDRDLERRRPGRGHTLAHTSRGRRSYPAPRAAPTRCLFFFSFSLLFCSCCIYLWGEYLHVMLWKDIVTKKSFFSHLSISSLRFFFRFCVFSLNVCLHSICHFVLILISFSFSIWYYLNPHAYFLRYFLAIFISSTNSYSMFTHFHLL